MIWSVPLVDGSAARATLARIARIDIDDRDASARGLIGDECAKLSKGPIMQAVAIFAAGRNPCADMRQLFQRNAAQGAFSINHNSLRNYVVCVFLKPRLFSRQFLETTLRRLCSAALKAGTALGGLPSSVFNFLAGVDHAVAIGGERNNTKIDSEPIGWLEAFRFWNVTRASEKPLAAHKTQIDLALAEGEQIALLLTGDEIDLHAAFDRPDRNRVSAFEAENATIVRLRGERAENRRGFTIDFEGVRYLGNAANGGLRRQFELGTSFDIDQFLKIELTEDASREALRRNRRARLIAANKRRPKRGGLFARRLELDGCNEFHSFKYRSNLASIQVGNGAFLPGLKAGASSAEKR